MPNNNKTKREKTYLETVKERYNNNSLTNNDIKWVIEYCDRLEIENNNLHNKIKEHQDDIQYIKILIDKILKF